MVITNDSFQAFQAFWEYVLRAYELRSFLIVTYQKMVRVKHNFAIKYVCCFAFMESCKVHVKRDTSKWLCLK